MASRSTNAGGNRRGGRVRGQGTVLARRSNQRPSSSNVRIRMSANRPPSRGLGGANSPDRLRPRHVEPRRPNPRAHLTGETAHIAPSAVQAAARPSAIPDMPPAEFGGAGSPLRGSAEGKQSLLPAPSVGLGAGRRSSEASPLRGAHPLESPAASRAPAAEEPRAPEGEGADTLSPLRGANVAPPAQTREGRSASARTGLSKLLNLKGRKGRSSNAGTPAPGE